ncbi:iron-containing alcohol dehydrogenase [Brevibacterium sp. 'Marine']|uniref:iron-containing alcohol dehydrogenase family protein n=1 Tax=Brevibacterium sp. 'Marine' TaxID=2725563 RepID=UPI00145EB85B|nr:iron-containing alcohol dehydrogenase [Brevibacterium sp. 'Marine']
MSQRWWPSATSDSVFLSPSVVVGGTGATDRLGEILVEHLGLRDGSVLLAVDDAVFDAGLIQPIAEGLQADGYRVHVHGGFGAEPTAEVVDQVADKARAEDVQAVIGIGGGSVLDSSKIIALLLRNEGGAADWIGSVNPEPGVAPLVLIPTTCGTGSESTRIAMVTVDGHKRVSSCPKFVPQIAVIDPKLVGSLPPSVIAATGMDALAHATESLMSTGASVLSAHHSLRGIEMIVDNLEAAYNGNSDSLAAMLWGAHIAGQSLNSGVVLGHSLAYSLANAQPMPHGVSCAIALPYCIAYNQNLDPQLAETLALTLSRSRSSNLRDAAQEVLDLSARMGLPQTLSDVRVSPTAVPEMARLCVHDYPRPTNPEPFDEELIAELFACMENADLDQAFDLTRPMALMQEGNA